MAVAPVEMNLVGPKRLAHDVRRSEISALLSTAMRPSVPTKQAPPRLRPFRLDNLPINNHTIAILIAGPAILHESFDRTGIVRSGGPLNDVVVMLAPIEFADVEPMGRGDAIIRQPGRRPEIKVPIQTLRNRLAGPNRDGQKTPPPSRYA